MTIQKNYHPTPFYSHYNIFFPVCQEITIHFFDILPYLYTDVRKYAQKKEHGHPTVFPFSV